MHCTIMIRWLYGAKDLWLMYFTPSEFGALRLIRNLAFLLALWVERAGSEPIRLLKFKWLAALPGVPEPPFAVQ